MLHATKLIFIIHFGIRTVFCSSDSLQIPKCCPQDEHFDKSLKCTKSKSTNENWDWLMKIIQDKDHRSSSTMNPVIMANTTLNCTASTRAMLFSINEEFEVVLLEDGRLQFDVEVYSHGEEKRMVFEDSFCFDSVFQAVLFCPCVKVPCVNKCCHEGYSFNASSTKCIPNDEDGYWHPNFMEGEAEDGYYLLANRKPNCEGSSVVIVPASEFNVSGDVSVLIPGYKNSIPWTEYCGDSSMFLVCPQRHKEIKTKYKAYGILLIVIGGLFIVSVVVSGWLLPLKLRRNLHTRVVTAHNAALGCAYLATGCAQIMGEMRDFFCVSTAFIIQFAFLAAFLWLNVMCIDIAWAFSGLRPPQGSAMERDHKKFLFYSAYAWGVTGIISIVTAIVEFVPGIDDASPLKPNIGRHACWFHKPAATLAYFYGPIAFVLVMNLALFLYTAARIIAVRRDTAILNSARNTSGSAVQKDRQRLILYVKLFCLMGLTWVTEIISWAVGGAEYYWYITDAVNMLRAVFIFVIFCCKRSVLHLLKVRLASFLPCSSELARGKSTTSYSGPTSSLRLSSVKKSVRRPSQDV